MRPNSSAHHDIATYLRRTQRAFAPRPVQNRKPYTLRAVRHVRYASVESLLRRTHGVLSSITQCEHTAAMTRSEHVLTSPFRTSVEPGAPTQTVSKTSSTVRSDYLPVVGQTPRRSRLRGQHKADSTDPPRRPTNGELGRRRRTRRRRSGEEASAQRAHDVPHRQDARTSGSGNRG